MFSWTDRKNGVGRWVSAFPSGHVLSQSFVTSEKQDNFEKIDQPCRECWGDECDEIEEESNLEQIDNPIESIQKIFDDYTKYQESTDSDENKNLVKASLESLSDLTNPKDLEVLINLWMYYDPTDFPTRDLAFKALKDSRPESILAVKVRMENKLAWEKDNSAPYSELSNLKERLEIE